MSDDKHLESLFKLPKAQFEDHITIPYNSRIIFSGIYGIGKSYFLRRFFSLPEIKPRFEVIRLSPVNYTISSNEDILKYIKYDLLIELILRGVKVDELDLNLSHYLALYLQENWKEIGKTVLTAAGKLSKIKVGDIEIFEQVVNFFGKLPNLKKYINNKQEKFDEATILLSFMKEVEQLTHLYDETLVTRIIEKKIEELQSTPGSQRKESVLIIDDLDRIDPEHIFRILNVFGAHFENIDFENINFPAKNKFSFDKVILVCDIGNIRKIFYSKYGADVDFSGYIDKFYTHEVFNFDIRSIIHPLVYEVAAKFNLGFQNLQKKLTEHDDQLFHYIVRALFKHNSINLRSFLKFYRNSGQIHFRSAEVGDFVIDPTKNTLLWQLILIKQMIGDRETMQHAISKLHADDFIDDSFDLEKSFRKIVFTSTILIHRYRRDYTYQFDLNGSQFSFELEESKIAFGEVSKLKYYKDGPDYDPNDPIFEEINCYAHFIPSLKVVFR